MTERLIYSISIGVILFSATAGLAQFLDNPLPKRYTWSDPKLSPDERADLVLKEMTIDEKIALVHGAGMSYPDDPPESNGGAGYTKAIPRLGIPSIQMADSAYGVTRGAKKGRYSTALPNNLAAASSWDPDTVFVYGALIGRELREQGYSMSLGGGVNLAREPRNGRTFEYEGEDPVLAGTLAGSFTKGVQSENIIGDIKHFALNDQESGRDAVNVNVDERTMRETDLLAFEIALTISDSGGVMCSYNRVNSDYACENSHLLADILKRDFHFKGFVLSDWGATHSLEKASRAGLDMEQPGEYFYGDALKKAVQAGQVSELELNDHVHRILRSIFAVGLYDRPVTTGVPDIQRGMEQSQRIAEKSMVLLKNDNGVLPLEGVRRVALIGGHADVAMLSGGGSAQVDPPGGSPIAPPPPKDLMESFIRPAWMPTSPLRALRAVLPGVDMTYASGDDVAAAVAAARHADVAIVFAYQWEAESFDLPTLNLEEKQNRLVEAIAAANPKTVVVLETGSPVTMPWADKVTAIVEAWYPGIKGSEALANILIGSVNPSGKLALTFPRSDEDLPHPMLVLPPASSKPNYSAVKDMADFTRINAMGLPAFQISYDEKLKVGYKWYDAEKKPVLFPFGFGLSYTTFAYSGLTVSSTESLTVSFAVKNTGKRAGTKIAEIYASMPNSTGEPPKRLIGWTRVSLDAGAAKEVSVPISRERLKIFDVATKAWKLVPGDYAVMVGGSSQDLDLRRVMSF